MGREWEGAGVGKSISDKQYFILSGAGTVHGEMDTKNSHRGLLRSTPLPHPSPSSFPALANRHRPVTFPLQEQADPGLRWPLPGAGKKGVCVKEGKKVDQ